MGVGLRFWLSVGYLGAPPPQVSSSSRLAPQDVLPPSSSSACKFRHLQDFPQDIPLPILCWTGSVTGIGSHLVCCCRGVRFSLFDGSFAFLGDIVCFYCLICSWLPHGGSVEVDVSASHVIVGIFIVVYSSVDPINTPCSSCPSCHSTQPSDGHVPQKLQGWKEEEPLPGEDTSVMNESEALPKERQVTHPTWKLGITWRGTGFGRTGIPTGDGEDTVLSNDWKSSSSLVPFPQVQCSLIREIAAS